MYGSERDIVSAWANCNLHNGFNPHYCGSRYYCYQVLDRSSETVVRLDDDYYVFARPDGFAIRRYLTKLRLERYGEVPK